MASLVLSLRWGSVEGAAGAIARAREVASDVERAGGHLVGFGAFEVSFAFDPKNAAQAISLAVALAKTSGSFQRGGIAEGELLPFDPEPPSGWVALGWGDALIVASALARLAQAGELLVDQSVGLCRDGALRARAEGREINVGGTPRKSILLDTDAPFVDLDTDPNRRARRDTGSYLIEVARDVLAKGEAASVDDFVAQLSLTGEPAEVVERLAGVLAMTRGATAEGLRVRRRAAQVEQPGEKRARSILAYAIGVAAAGRPEDGLLEGLSALALARATGDDSGERACARFLSQLSASAGHPEAARAWDYVARGGAPVRT
ncbi:MAG: hypothetical protein U0271_45890 [Polyangiaceae bacterium]